MYILLYQTYNNNIYILNQILAYYYDTNITDTSTPYNVYYKEIIDTDILPPIMINNSGISFYNVFNIINKIENKEYWIKMTNNNNNNEFQLKDFESTIFVDGNYLFYYNNNINQPIIFKHPDIFKETITVNNVDFNVYENKITLTTFFIKKLQ